MTAERWKISCNMYWQEGGQVSFLVGKLTCWIVCLFVFWNLLEVKTFRGIRGTNNNGKNLVSVGIL